MARVAVLTESQFVTRRQPMATVTTLRDRGHTVDLLIAGRVAARLGDLGHWTGYDVLLTRGSSTELVSLARWLTSYGIPVVNGPDAITTVTDRSAQVLALSRAGVPVPETWLARPRSLSGLPADTFPLAVHELAAHPVGCPQIARNPADLAALTGTGAIALVQRIPAQPSFDVTLVGVGAHVWTAPRRQPPRTPGGGSPVLTPELESLALYVAGVLGLDLYQIDLVGTAAGPMVTGVHAFPDYEAMSGADAMIADLVQCRGSQPWSQPGSQPGPAGRTAAPKPAAPNQQAAPNQPDGVLANVCAPRLH